MEITAVPQMSAITPTTQIPDVPKEAAPEAAKAPEAPKDEQAGKEAARIAAILKKESALLRTRRELDDEKKRIEEERNRYKHWAEAAELAKQDKLKALEKLGIGYDELTAQILNDGKVPPEIIAQRKAEEVVSKRLEEFQKTEAEKRQNEQKSQYENALKQISADAKTLADTSNKFPLVKTSNAYDDIAKDIESEFHRSGRLMPIEEAMTKMEQQIAQDLRKLMAADPELALLLQAKKETLKEQEKPVEPNVTTLTHKVATASPATKAMTNAERRQRAIDAFYGRA